MWCSRWLSIQSSPAHVTPVDWRCAFQESRQFDATKTSIRSIHSSTHASLPGNQQIHQKISKRAPNQRPGLTLESAMERAKQLPRGRQLLPADVATCETPSSFVFLPSCAVFQRGATAFVFLVQSVPPPRDLQSGLKLRRNATLRLRGNDSDDHRNSRLCGQFLPFRQRFLPFIECFHGHPTRLSVERAVVQLLNLVFSTGNQRKRNL